MPGYFTKISKFLLILFLVTGWFFNLQSEIQKAHAAISFVGAAAASSTPNTDTTVTISGLGLQEGDLVIVAGAIGDDDNVNHNVLNNTAGYIEINDLFADDGDDTNLAVWYKLMSSTPDTSVVVEGSTGGTDSSLAVVVMAFRGVDQSTPFDVASTSATGINTADADPPSIDHLNPAGLWTVIAGASGYIIAALQTYTMPTGYTTNAISGGKLDTNNITVGMGYKSSPSDPEDPGIMNHSGTDATTNSWAAITMALRPALALTFEQSAYRIFGNANSTDVGSALATQDTAATLSSTGDAFRLRMLLHIGAANLFTSGQNFKLQFAQQSGTCDTAFSGETYADVTGSTVIAYNNNATPADGDNLTANASDPTHSGDTIVNQDYEEANNFTNTVATIPAAQDGKWDFALIDNGASASTAYCFRVVKSDGAVLNTYSVIPQITTAAASSLTFTVSTNNFPTVTPGSPVFATTTLSVDTNSASGWNVTVSRDDADTTLDLDSDATVNITDQTDWIPGAATTTAGNATRISSFINSSDVLALRVMTSSGTPSFVSTDWWGTTDSYADSPTTLWAGVASSTATNLQIGNSSVSCSGANCALNTVLYYLDVSPTQKTGAYSGSITYTATINP